MYKMLKIGVYFGIVASLTACNTSEHFMQDDVYNTRTPIMPPGTDLNDVTDYATFVAKKEQSAEPEQVTYVSPRQYNDYFYASQYVNYGYSPYSSLTGLSYPGYGNYYGMSFGFGYGNGLYGGGYNPYGYGGYGYNHPYYGGYYGNNYNPYGYYNGYGSPYYGYGNPYYGGGYYPYSGNTSWYSPSSKPNTGSNLSHASAGTAAGRGSNTAPINYYPHQISANPGNTRFSGVSRTSDARINNVAPVVNSSGRTSTANRVQPIRPAGTTNPSTGGQRTGSYQDQQRPRVNSSNNNGATRPTINNSNNNSTPTRTSTPTMRSGGSSGGGGGTPSSGGSRSGGRR